MSDIYLSSVQFRCSSSVVQGAKCWDRYCSHKTLQFSSSLVVLPTAHLANLLGAKRAACAMFHMPWDQYLREPEICAWVLSAHLGSLLPDFLQALLDVV